jgi:hypothetical protein
MFKWLRKKKDPPAPDPRPAAHILEIIRTSDKADWYRDRGLGSVKALLTHKSMPLELRLTSCWTRSCVYWDNACVSTTRDEDSQIASAIQSVWFDGGVCSSLLRARQRQLEEKLEEVKAFVGALETKNT